VSEESEPTRQSSTGLGLYIAKQIAVAHGGSIGVRSTVEEGTTFDLHLPRVAPT
jgi:signal transduction histidine kinase